MVAFFVCTSIDKNSIYVIIKTLNLRKNVMENKDINSLLQGYEIYLGGESKDKLEEVNKTNQEMQTFKEEKSAFESLDSLIDEMVGKQEAVKSVGAYQEIIVEKDNDNVILDEKSGVKEENQESENVKKVRRKRSFK